ncbi:MAG TPA: hypothetical protein VMT05_12800 [Terriglobales bacterium]|jgi:hypothetical protein|nr:hypothetical protein [Terriglobales bacterium]
MVVVDRHITCLEYNPVFEAKERQEEMIVDSGTLWIRLATGLLLAAISTRAGLPVGTVVPVMLRSSLNAKKDGAGKKVEGEVMQEVPLSSGGKISRRSRITGQVVSVTRPGSSGSSIVLKFDAIQDNGQTIPLTAALLAVASFTSVADAQSPIDATSNVEHESAWVTRQVGGDVVNRGRGKVGTRLGVVGRWLEGSSVLAQLTPNPDAGCPSGPGYDREQAVWVFSSSACGTYGLGDLKIASSGSTPPLGNIVLTSSQNVEIRGGSGWLLIVATRQ